MPGDKAFTKWFLGRDEEVSFMRSAPGLGLTEATAAVCVQYQKVFGQQCKAVAEKEHRDAIDKFGSWKKVEFAEALKPVMKDLLTNTKYIFSSTPWLVVCDCGMIAIGKDQNVMHCCNPDQRR
jgi:hypothetical protein